MNVIVAGGGLTGDRDIHWADPAAQVGIAWSRTLSVDPVMLS